MAEPIRLADFSGGILESVSSGDFTTRQWSQLTGFMLESETQLRSQWECQQVSNVTGFAAVRAFTTLDGRYLVGIKSDGTLWWCVAPGRTAAHTTAAAVTWNPLTTGTFADPDHEPATGAIPASTAYRFITEIQLMVPSPAGDENVAQLRTGLLIHSRAGSTPAVVVHEVAGSSSTLAAALYDDFFPGTYLATPEGVVTGDPEQDTEEFTKSYVMPRANCGAMWGNFLVLGDVQYFKNPQLPFGVGNRRRYKNALWISTVDGDGLPSPHNFHPIDSMHFVASGEAQVRGLQRTDRGLLVLTTSATAGDGVILLRGSPPDGTLASYVPELLRGGMGVPTESTDTTGVSHVMWPEAGATVFLEDRGAVWHTNGNTVGRLDRYGPNAPKEAVQIDSVAATGPYLFISRAGRMLVMRMFEEDGAWTELVTPNGVQPRSLSAMEDCVYFVADGKVYRYAEGAPLRGHINGQAVDLTLSTAPLGNPLEHSKKSWFRIGARLTNQVAGELRSITSRAGSPLLATPAPSYTTTLNRSLAARDEVVVKAHGPSTEASVTVVLRGDVLVESVTVWMSGKEPSR